jgi:hypothetical protein
MEGNERKLGRIMIGLGALALAFSLGGRARPLEWYGYGQSGYWPPPAVAAQGAAGAQWQVGPEDSASQPYGRQTPWGTANSCH